MLNENSWKGLKYLFPNARPLIHYLLTNAPLMPDDTVLGPLRIIEWKLPNPQPSDDEINAAIPLYDALITAESTRKETLRTLAQGLIGRGVADTFTVAELKLLLFKLIHNDGGLDAGKIRDFSEW